MDFVKGRRHVTIGWVMPQMFMNGQWFCDKQANKEKTSKLSCRVMLCCEPAQIESITLLLRF